MTAEPSTGLAPVTHLAPITGGRRRGPVTVREAVDAFLCVPRGGGSTHTRRAYSDVLHRVAARLGPDRELAAIDGDEVADALTALWGAAAPATWNRNRAAVSSWLSWCTTKARWPAPSLPSTCERRREPRDHTRAVDRATIETICTRRDIALRERLLWRMLYETASRAAAVLALNVDELDLENRRAATVVKGGDTGWLVWGRGTALLLPRYRGPAPARQPITVTRRDGRPIAPRRT